MRSEGVKEPKISFRADLSDVESINLQNILRFTLYYILFGN